MWQLIYLLMLTTNEIAVKCIQLCWLFQKMFSLDIWMQIYSVRVLEQYTTSMQMWHFTVIANWKCGM